MPSKRLANPDSASVQLLARTDGRTNGRPTHLNEIPSVPERARFFQSDIDLAVFLESRARWKVLKEKPRAGAAERRKRNYDRETENQLSFIRGQRAAQAETSPTS